jgi:Cu/Ag efflux pump CusA
MFWQRPIEKERALFMRPIRLDRAGGIFLFGALAGSVLLVAGGCSRKAIPVQVTVTASYPGASAEEVERQATIPLEVSLAGAPGLEAVRSQSQFGLSSLRIEFRAGVPIDKARAEVVNRLGNPQALPPGVVPRISLVTNADEILRYTLESPRDRLGRDIYTLNDLRALQDVVVEREFRRVPGVADVASAGGTVRQYEIHPDPERLRRCGVTLRQLEAAITAGSDDVGRIGLFGDGMDPVQEVLDLKDPQAAADKLREEEKQSILALRKRVIASVNKKDVLIDDVVDGGRVAPGQEIGLRGVVVGTQSRRSRVGLGRAGETDKNDKVAGIVYMRPGEDRQKTLGRVESKLKALNEQPGRSLPGVRLEPFSRCSVAGRTTACGAPGEALHVLARFPAAVTLERVSENVQKGRTRLLGRPEVRSVLSQMGWAEEDFRNVHFVVLLRPEKDWPLPPGTDRPRTQSAIIDDLRTDLEHVLPGVEWDVIQDNPDAFDGIFRAAPGEHLLKIFGPDLDRLEALAEEARKELARVEGVQTVRVRSLLGRPTSEFRIDAEKCKKWGVRAADVYSVIDSAYGGKVLSTRIEGDKRFDIAVRWPAALRRDNVSILDLPIDVANNEVNPGQQIKDMPRLRLRDLVSLPGKDDKPNLERIGASSIDREDGRRMISVRFRVAGRPAADAVAEARKKLAPLFKSPYRANWTSGSE